MTFNSSGRSVKSLKSSDKNFTFSPDGVTLVSRAALEISSKCPERYKWVIMEALNNKWIEPVAYMRDTEYLVEVLKE